MVRVPQTSLSGILIITPTIVLNFNSVAVMVMPIDLVVRRDARCSANKNNRSVVWPQCPRIRIFPINVDCLGIRDSVEAISKCGIIRLLRTSARYLYSVVVVAIKIVSKQKMNAKVCAIQSQKPMMAPLWAWMSQK